MPSAEIQSTNVPSDSVCAVVLGANGFLGAALVKQLEQLGHRVVAVSRRPPMIESSDTPAVTKLVGDVRVHAVLERAFKGADIVFHAAASTHPTLNADDPSAEIEMAILPLLTVMKTAEQCGIRKVVFPSSGGTIYAEQSAPRTEQTAVNPRTPYAIFKFSAEQLLLAAADRNGCAVDVMRIANLYGPGQPARPGQGVLPHWFAALRGNKPLVLFGDGAAERDYVFIDDAAYCLASRCQQLNKTDVFNVGTGNPTSLNELIAMLRQISPKPFNVEQIPARPTDIQSVSLDASKLTRELQNFKWTSLEAGLQHCWNRVFGRSDD